MDSICGRDLIFSIDQRSKRAPSVVFVTDHYNRYLADSVTSYRTSESISVGALEQRLSLSRQIGDGLQDA